MFCAQVDQLCCWFFADLRQGREVNETRAHSLQRHSAKRWLASTTKPPAWTVCPRRSGYPQLVAVSRSPLAREPSFDRMRRPKNLQLPCWLWRPKPSWLINCFESRCIFLSFCDVITLTIRELLAVAAVIFVLPKYCQHWRTVLSHVSVAPPHLSQIFRPLICMNTRTLSCMHFCWFLVT